MMASISSTPAISAARRFTYYLELTRTYVSRRSGREDVKEWADDLRATYEAAAGGRLLSDAAVLEIGYGQRPYRLLWLHGMCRTAEGLDLEEAVFGVNFAALRRIWRCNGPLRAAKTAVRSLVWAGASHRRFKRAYSAEFKQPLAQPDGMLRVGDAAQAKAWEGLAKPDLVYIWDVLEHVPPEELGEMLRLCAEAMGSEGLLIANVDPFTGLSGGHEPRWFLGRMDTASAQGATAWRHLRESAPRADTYLNRLRLIDYDAAFAQHFEVLTRTLDLRGADLLTDELSTALADYSEEELLTARVKYVARPRALRPAA